MITLAEAYIQVGSIREEVHNILILWTDLGERKSKQKLKNEIFYFKENTYINLNVKKQTH